MPIHDYQPVQDRLDATAARRRKLARSPGGAIAVLLLLGAVGLLVGRRSSGLTTPLLILGGFGLWILFLQIMPRVLKGKGVRVVSQARVGEVGVTIMPLRPVDSGLAQLGALPVPESSLPELHSALSAMCLAAGMSLPDLFIVEADALNAFVLCDSTRSAVGVTRGLVESLAPGEMSAVVAPLLVRLRRGHLEVHIGAGIGSTEDVEALQLHRDPEAMLGAYGKVLNSDNMIPWAWGLGPETFFSYDNPLTRHLHRGQLHPRIAYAREMLGAFSATE